MSYLTKAEYDTAAPILAKLMPYVTDEDAASATRVLGDHNTTPEEYNAALCIAAWMLSQGCPLPLRDPKTNAFAEWWKAPKAPKAPKRAPKKATKRRGKA